MTWRQVLFAAITLAMMVPGAPSQARPEQHAAPVRAVAHVMPLVAAASTVMVTHTGAARTQAPARPANGIAGGDLVRPAVRSTAGGASMRSGGIDGGTVHRRH
jgi:hypothetical protein